MFGIDVAHFIREANKQISRGKSVDLLGGRLRRGVRRTQLSTFLFLTLIALGHGCRSTTQAPEPGREAQKADAGGKSTRPEGDLSRGPEPPAQSTPRESLPESLLSFPEKELASARLTYDTVLVARAADTPAHYEWQYRKNRQSQIVGFQFSNRGGNRILPYRYDIRKNLFFTRDFQFRFDDRARQDIHVFISDWGPSKDGQFRLSGLVSSVMHFFPRNYLPAIVRAGERTVVTLPTGEKVEFDANTHEVLGGVFSEAPVDLNPDKGPPKVPGIDYIGRALVVRANARGADPRLKTMALITTGSPAPGCEKGIDCDRCEVPSHELWDQTGAVRFRFSTDEEFNRYLLSRCEFGIPKNVPDFTPAAPLE